MPVILETISWILKDVNVGVDRLIVGWRQICLQCRFNEVEHRITVPVP